MRYARRVQNVVASPSMALAARVRALRAQGVEVIDFGRRPAPPAHVRRAAIEYLESADGSSYTDARGLAALREAIAAKLARENALDVDPQREIVVTAGAKQAVFAALMALVESGDEVLIEDPGWVGFTPIVELTGATPVAVPLLARDGFAMDVDTLRKRLSRRTRALVLCNPHNPTGCVLDESRLQAISEVACDNDLIVIADEAYERLLFDGRRHVSIATLPGMRERTVTVQTTSKVYNMGGWRVGWIAAVPDISMRIAAIQSTVISCPTAFAQAGAIAALNAPIGMGDRPIDALLEDLSMRRDALVAGLRDLPGVQCVTAAGGFFVFPDFSAYNLDADAMSRRLLEQARVAAMPGSAFGAGGESHLRLLFTSPIAEIETGLARMADALTALPRRA